MFVLIISSIQKKGYLSDDFFYCNSKECQYGYQRSYPREKNRKNHLVKLLYSAIKMLPRASKALYFLLTLTEARLKDKRFKETSLPVTP